MFEKDRERNSEREDEGVGRPSLIFHKDNQASLCSCVFALKACRGGFDLGRGRRKQNHFVEPGPGPGAIRPLVRI